MKLRQKLLSMLLGASLSLPIFSTSAKEFSLNNQDGFQIKSSVGTTNSIKPKVSIEFIVDDILDDRASHQFYSALNRSNILYKTQEKVSHFFSKLGIDSNIRARKGFVTPLLPNSQGVKRNTDGIIRVYYLESDKLKEYYDLDPKRYFIDRERPSWLDEFYSMNIKGFNRNAYSEEAIKRFFDECLLTRFNEVWYFSLRKEVAGGFAAVNTQRAYIYPLHRIFKKAVNSDEEEANVLSVVQIHEILHLLGEEDVITSSLPNIMCPFSYLDKSKDTLRERLNLYLDGQIMLSPEMVGRIKTNALNLLR
jgi:hypothetical protein